MIIRTATIEDIQEMQIIRNAVIENKLSDPSLIKDTDYELFLTEKGKGWVCEWDNQIVGFAIIDLQGNNIWALFLHPDFEHKGIGRILHKTMLDWYFSQTDKTVWLSTAFNTRAEQFYKKAGWKAVGMYGTKEIKFEMSYTDWIDISNPYNDII